VIRTASESETRAVGAAFARSLSPGFTISLEGPLGAGKTVFVRGLCDGLGVNVPVTSPTYTLQNEYAAADGVRVIHLDCFRLASAAELEDLGVEDRREPGTSVIVEWGDRVLAALPRETIRVAIGPDPEEGESHRRILVALPEGVALPELDPAGGEG
jgi:tRNA threonylcarbamoyladenosine biosynthesis protein TsaE